MKYFSGLFLLTAAIAIAQSPAAPKPKTAPPVKVGVVDVRRVLVETNDGKKAIAAMNAEFETRRNDLERKKSAVGDLQLRLNLGGNNLSAADRDNLQRSIEEQTREQNRLVDDMQAEVQQEEQRIVDQLRLKLVEVAGKYALTNGFTIIAETGSGLLHFDKRLDITADIIEQFDKAAPAVVPAGKK